MCRLSLWLIVLAIERSVATKHRSVNLALETVVEFDKFDDVKVVNKVQDFLTKVQSLLNKKHRSDLSTRRKNLYQFSDFLEDVIIEVQSLEDDDLLEIFNIIKKNVQKRKANDILDDNGRRYLSGKLTVLRQRPVVEIRNDLDDLLRELRNDKQSKSNYILGFINTLYERDAQNKLKKFVKRLNIFRRSGRKSKIDLKDIIEKVINDVIYEHYNNLEGDERRHIKKYVRSFFVDDVPKEEKIKPAEDKETTKNVNTDEESGESEEQAVDASPFTDNTKISTVKISKNNNLYPKTTKVTRSQKHEFRTGIPVREYPLEDVTEKHTDEDRGEDSGQRFKAEDGVATHEIFANHSFEINVNLLLKKHKDSREENNSNKNNYQHSLSQRASTKKTRKQKKHRTTTATLSTETFGSLHKKTTKKHISKKKSRAPKTRSTAKEAILRTMMNVDTVERDSGVHPDDDRRRSFKNSHREDHNPVKTTIKQAIRRANIPIERFYNFTLTTRVNKVISPTMRTHRTTTTSRPVVTTTEDTTSSPASTVTATTTTTHSDVFNEIQHKNVTDAELSDEFDNLDLNLPERTDLVDSNKTSANGSATFNIDDYLKKSDLGDVENEDKLKDIQDTMRKDFKMLMSTPTTTTTETVTDVFKELEDAFDI